MKSKLTQTGAGRDGGRVSARSYPRDVVPRADAVDLSRQFGRGQQYGIG